MNVSEVKAKIDGFWEASSDVSAYQNTETDNMDLMRISQVIGTIAEEMPEVSRLQEATKSEIERLRPILVEEELRAALTSIRIELLKKKDEALAELITWGRLTPRTTRVWRYGSETDCLFSHAWGQSFVEESPVTGAKVFSPEHFFNYASTWLKSKLSSIDDTNMLSAVAVEYSWSGNHSFGGNLRCCVSISVFDD